MKQIRIIVALAAFLCGAAACTEDEPNCKASEGEGCLNSYDACMYAITHDTDTETDTETVTDTDTSAGSAAEVACHDDYCACLDSVGCQADVCVDTGT
jgi:hypothetical protein